MEVLVVRGRFHWGFSVKYPLQSAAQLSLLAPPPTTLVGALAFGCNDGIESVDGRSAAVKYLKYVRWAAFGFDEAIGVKLSVLATADMTRNVISPYVRRRGEQLFGVQAMGKVYLPGIRVKLAYFGEGLSQLVKCAWQMTRVGNKESLFEPVEVDVFKAEGVDRESFATSFYVRADAARPLNVDEVVEQTVWPLGEESFRFFGEPPPEVKLYVPARLKEVEYEGSNVIKFGDELYAL